MLNSIIVSTLFKSESYKIGPMAFDKVRQEQW